MTQLMKKAGEPVWFARPGRKIIVCPTLWRITVVLAACLFPVLAFAQNDNWLGGTGNWNNSSLWSAGVPTNTSNVFVDNGNAKASAVMVSDVEQCANLTIDSDDSVTLVNSAVFTVFGPTISNAGTLLLNATSGTNFDISGTVTLTGAGGLTMSNNAGNVIFGYGQGSGATLINKSTIQGAGTIQPGCSNTFNNQGTVNANQTTPLYISICSGPSANTGTLEATNGGTLVLEGNTEGGGTFDNTGGTIHADASSAVQLYGSAIVKNGKLTTSGSGAIQSNNGNGAATLDGVTISGTHQVLNGFEYLAHTITNNGSFQIGTGGNAATVDISGSVTLKGTGTVAMSNNANTAIFGYGQGTGDSLTNQSTIQGAGTIQPGCSNTFNNQGTVNANQTTPLYISICSGPSANTGTLEATNGGTLVLEGNTEGGGTFDNTGGTIHADASSVVQLYGSAIVKNGSLTATNTGATQCNGNNGFCTLDGVTISGTHQVIAGGEYLADTITNGGSFLLGSNTGNANLDMIGNVVLKGSGGLNSVNANNAIFGYGQQTGATLTNQSTIEGEGVINIPGSGGSFTNQHTVSANLASTLFINTGSGPFTNTGMLKVGKKSGMAIQGGDFTNFSGTTLSAGKYMVSGTLEFDGANIVTNAASITLTGAKAAIVNQSNVNALANFATNAKAGSLSLMSGNLLTTSGSVTNAGTLKVGPKSGLQTGSGSYTQTTGQTTVDGVLTAPAGASIQAGKLYGKGSIVATVVSDGSVTAGDSTSKAGQLSMSTYTQNSDGSLNVQIGGVTEGTQYSRLAVGNGASLNGTLNIKLINGFIPAIGNTFNILTGGAVTGKFATVNGLSINGGEHFTITYNSTNVTLTVVSGP